MKTIIVKITLLLLLTFGKMNGQCGLSLGYSWLAGPCDTVPHDITLFINGSTCTNSFSIQWENASTAMSTQLDTGYHYIYVWDCFGCLTTDTFFIGCAGFEEPVIINNFNSINAELEIFPNPSINDELTISVEGIEFKTISVYSVMGVLIYRSDLVFRHNLSLDTKNYMSGVYHVVINGVNGEQLTSRFIKP